jgi:hypothetical protein
LIGVAVTVWLRHEIFALCHIGWTGFACELAHPQKAKSFAAPFESFENLSWSYEADNIGYCCDRFRAGPNGGGCTVYSTLAAPEKKIRGIAAGLRHSFGILSYEHRFGIRVQGFKNAKHSHF